MPTTPTFQGSFIDIVHANPRDGVYWNRKTIAYNESDWHALIQHLHRDFGLTELVILNVCAPHGAFLFPCPSLEGSGNERRFPTRCEDPVGAILNAAEEFGMKVFLGLGLAPEIDMTGTMPELTSARMTWYTRLAGALLKRYGHLKSFHGIYVSYEPHFETTGLLPQGNVEWLGKVTSALRPLIDGRPLMCCPFHLWKIVEGKPDPAVLAAQIRATGIDIICPQDGVGFTTVRDPRPATRSAAAAKILGGACREAGAEFWYHVEIFAFENEVLFQPLLPAPWSRVLEQLELAADVTDKIIAYQVPGLMSSQSLFPGLGDPSTDELYTAYQNHLSAFVPNRT